MRETIAFRGMESARVKIHRHRARRWLFERLEVPRNGFRRSRFRETSADKFRGRNFFFRRRRVWLSDDRSWSRSRERTRRRRGSGIRTETPEPYPYIETRRALSRAWGQGRKITKGDAHYSWPPHWGGLFSKNVNILYKEVNCTEPYLRKGCSQYETSCNLTINFQVGKLLNYFGPPKICKIANG